MAHKVPLITQNLWFPIGGSKQHHFAQLYYGVGLGKLLKRNHLIDSTQGWAVWEMFYKITKEARTLFLFSSLPHAHPLPPWLGLAAPLLCQHAEICGTLPPQEFEALCWILFFLWVQAIDFCIQKDLEAYAIAPDVYSWGCMGKLGRFGEVLCSLITMDTWLEYPWKH